MKKDPIDLQLFVNKNLLFDKMLFIYYCKLYLKQKLYLRPHTSYDVAIFVLIKYLSCDVAIFVLIKYLSCDAAIFALIKYLSCNVAIVL
jgi:hypothetical protein